MLTAENISLKIGNKKILKDISFQANPGEILAIVGANGAGKSSLLKILSGELMASQGIIKLENKLLHAYSKKELAKKRAVLAQSFSLNLSFPSKEVVMMGRYPHFNEIPAALDHQIVYETMTQSGVLHLKDHLYTTLSGGEKQRIQLARVLSQIWDKSIRSSKYLFLDEPVSSLDLLHQHKTLEIARSMKEKGYTIIAVLHDLNLASQYADKIMMLKEGQIVAHGNTETILTEENIRDVFGLSVSIIHHADFNYPVVIPFSTHKEPIYF